MLRYLEISIPFVYFCNLLKMHSRHDEFVEQKTMPHIERFFFPLGEDICYTGMIIYVIIRCRVFFMGKGKDI